MSRKKLSNIDEVCEYFVDHYQDEGYCGNVSFKGDLLYSYSTVICVRIPHKICGDYVRNPVYLLCTSSYSNTTARHKSRAVSYCGPQDYVLTIGDVDKYCGFDTTFGEDAVLQLINDTLDDLVCDSYLNLNHKNDRQYVLDLNDNLHTLFGLYPNLKENISEIPLAGLAEKVKAAKLIQNQRDERYNK